MLLRMESAHQWITSKALRRLHSRFNSLKELCAGAVVLGRRLVQEDAVHSQPWRYDIL